MLHVSTSLLTENPRSTVAWPLGENQQLFLFFTKAQSSGDEVLMCSCKNMKSNWSPWSLLLWHHWRGMFQTAVQSHHLYLKRVNIGSYLHIWHYYCWEQNSFGNSIQNWKVLQIMKFPKMRCTGVYKNNLSQLWPTRGVCGVCIPRNPAVCLYFLIWLSSRCFLNVFIYCVCNP